MCASKTLSRLALAVALAGPSLSQVVPDLSRGSGSALQAVQLIVLDTAVGAPWSGLAPADVSDQGRVVGQAVVGGVTTGYEWTAAGGLATINSPYNGVGRINNAGDMVYPINPVVLANGTQIFVNNLFGNTTGVHLHDINDSRLVVGSAPGSGTTSNILVWDPVQGSRSFFVHAAEGLDRVNSGTLAVGNAVVNTSGSDGFVIDLANGQTTRFNATLPSGPTTWSIAVDVNNVGTVVGEGSDGVSLAAFTWNPAQGFRFLPGLAGGETIRVHPTAIDDRGRVVGMARTAAQEWRAFLWDPRRGMLDLNDRVQAPPGYVLHEAVDISETGVIIGRGTFNGAPVPQRGFILNSL